MKDRYREWIAKKPGWFRNPDGPVGIHIATDPDEIATIREEMRRRLASRGISARRADAWTRIGIVYEDPYLCLVRDAVRFEPGHVPGTYIRQMPTGDGPGGVVVLPLVGDDILLVRIFRHALRDFSLEFPRGFCERPPRGMDPDAAIEWNARRELAEETGAEAETIEHLGTCHTDTSFSGSGVAFCAARILSFGEPQVSEGIDQVVRISRPEMERRIAENGIVDGLTLMAYAKAKSRGIL